MRLLLALFVMALPGVHSLAIANSQAIPLFSFYEQSIVSDKKVQNPFDFSESGYYGHFESPTNVRYRIDAFFDGQSDAGNNIWKIRMMAKTPGIWRYRIFQSNDDGLVQEGNFSVSDTAEFAGNYGHVKVDTENPLYLIHDNGKPHYWIGGKWIDARDYGPASKEGQVNKGFDNRVDLPYGYKKDQQIFDYLDQLARYKHNGILLKIAQYPLENDRLSWDLEWIRRGEMIINEALKRGIYVQVNMFDTWSRSKDHYFKHSMPGDGQVFDVWEDGEDKFKLNYLRYIISRFASFSNVYWELGNEMEHSPNCGRCFVELANAKYLPWIREFDPYQLPIGLSEEKWRSTSADIGFLHQTDELPDSSMKRPVIMNELVRYDFYQTFFRKVWRKLFGPKLPRGLWHDDAMNNPDLRFVYRRTFWRVFTYGGSGSSEATWLDIDEDLSGAAQDVMADHKHLASITNRFSDSLNLSKPLPEFIQTESDGITVSTRGNENFSVSYLDAGRNNSTSASYVKLPTLGSDYLFEWYDPKSGETVDQGKLVRGADPKLTHPVFDEDLVLILERVFETQ